MHVVPSSNAKQQFTGVEFQQAAKVTKVEIFKTSHIYSI